MNEIDRRPEGHLTMRQFLRIVRDNTLATYPPGSILNRLTQPPCRRFNPATPAVEMRVMNYADARIEFHRATEAVLYAQRYETEKQLREASDRYSLAQKQLRLAKNPSIDSQGQFQSAASSI
jgi:hypothetical protein